MIHLYFEEDLIPHSEHEIEAKDAVRKQLYPLLYETEYRYGRKTSGTASTEPPPMPTESDLPPEMQETKPFIPATSPDDFAAVGLDGPMGY